MKREKDNKIVTVNTDIYVMCFFSVSQELKGKMGWNHAC